MNFCNWNDQNPTKSVTKGKIYIQVYFHSNECRSVDVMASDELSSRSYCTERSPGSLDNVFGIRMPSWIRGRARFVFDSRPNSQVSFPQYQFKFVYEWPSIWRVQTVQTAKYVLKWWPLLTTMTLLLIQPHLKVFNLLNLIWIRKCHSELTNSSSSKWGYCQTLLSGEFFVSLSKE